MQVREGASEGEPETVDQVLAQVDDMLIEGKYARAAATLEKGLSGKRTATRDLPFRSF